MGKWRSSKKCVISWNCYRVFHMHTLLMNAHSCTHYFWKKKKKKNRCFTINTNINTQPNQRTTARREKNGTRKFDGSKSGSDYVEYLIYDTYVKSLSLSLSLSLFHFLDSFPSRAVTNFNDMWYNAFIALDTPSKPASRSVIATPFLLYALNISHNTSTGQHMPETLHRRNSHGYSDCKCAYV